MEIIKLGDRIYIPSKNVKGEVAYIGKTQFSDGTWFGIILDDPIGKHDGAIGNKRYFKSARNHGMFLKASYFERECFNIISSVGERCSLNPKRRKYPASNCITKTKAQPQNVNVLGDNITNKNDENKELKKITESGDNCDDFDEKKIHLERRYPKCLKTKSKAIRNKNNGDKIDHDTNDNVSRNNDKNLMLLTIDSNDNPDKDENESAKRIIYPNYLKASSKLAGKHLCAAKRKDVKDDEMNETPKKTVEIQITKGRADKKDTSENPNAYLIKHPYQPKTSSNCKESHSARKNEMDKPETMPKSEDREIPKNNHISKDIRDTSTEMEEVKQENEQLKSKLRSTEESLVEFIRKYDDAQEEIKHLKYTNECQRKQIKFQKNHLKLLKMSQGNNFKQTDSNNKISKQKKIDEILEIALSKYDDTTNSSEGKCDLETPNTANSTQRGLELWEQNRLLLQWLVELRKFLKKQFESQPVEPEPLNSNRRARSPNKCNQKCTFSESFDFPIINSEAPTSDGSAAQTRECSEMVREMTKFNELIKDKRENVKEWVAINLTDDNSLLTNTHQNDTNHPFVQTEKDFPFASAFDINDENYDDTFQTETDSEAFENSSNLTKSDIQKNCQTVVDQNWQHFPLSSKMKGKLNMYHAGDGMPFESADCINKTRHEIAKKNVIHNENPSLANTTLMRQDDFDNEVPQYAGNCSSETSEVVPESPVDLPCHSTSTIVKSTPDGPVVMPKPKRSDRKNVY